MQYLLARFVSKIYMIEHYVKIFRRELCCSMLNRHVLHLAHTSNTYIKIRKGSKVVHHLIYRSVNPGTKDKKDKINKKIKPAC